MMLTTLSRISRTRLDRSRVLKRFLLFNLYLRTTKTKDLYGLVQFLYMHTGFST
jgi:hypothetical protein